MRLQVGDEIKFACVDGPEFDGHLVDFDQAMKRSQMYKTEEGRALLKLQEGDTIMADVDIVEVTSNGRCKDVKESSCKRTGSKGACNKHLKKFVLDIIRKKQWKRHRDVWAVKNRNA